MLEGILQGGILHYSKAQQCQNVAIDEITASGWCVTFTLIPLMMMVCYPVERSDSRSSDLSMSIGISPPTKSS